MGIGTPLLSSCAFVAAMLLNPGPNASRPGSGTQDSETLELAKAARPERFGQWIWTSADEALHAGGDPAAASAVLVATLKWDGHTITRTRGLAPARGKRGIVIRIDDAMHAVWDRRSPSAVAAGLGEQIAETLEEVAAVGTQVTEVQLDYDAPVRRLPRWAAVVKQLTERELAGVDVWLTSIPAHTGSANYGALFRGGAAGHILQLFDTGLPCDDRRATQLISELKAHDWPFRIGVGAFERGGNTAHGCWLRRWSDFRDQPGFSGLWLFPAGQPYRHLFES